MPSWTQKDERQYSHIKNSLQEQGKETSRAEEIAARIVNKQRRKEGRTPSRRTQGTGNPQQRLEERTYLELRNLASQLHIQGRGRMKKGELIQAIRASRHQ